jgi:hypothetical protein
MTTGKEEIKKEKITIIVCMFNQSGEAHDLSQRHLGPTDG